MKLLHAIDGVSAPDRAAFVRDILAADEACYTAPADRADFERLQAAITAFPAGFRLYLSGGKPVGYTGWYPVARDIFGDYLYLFNYSIIARLHKTAESRAMMQEFARTVRSTSHRGLVAVTVSPDGVRVAEKFGMTYRGDMNHDGVAESVYTLRLY